MTGSAAARPAGRPSRSARVGDHRLGFTGRSPLPGEVEAFAAHARDGRAPEIRFRRPRPGAMMRQKGG